MCIILSTDPVSNICTLSDFVEKKKTAWNGLLFWIKNIYKLYKSGKENKWTLLKNYKMITENVKIIVLFY